MNPRPTRFTTWLRHTKHRSRLFSSPALQLRSEVVVVEEGSVAEQAAQPHHLHHWVVGNVRAVERPLGLGAQLLERRLGRLPVDGVVVVGLAARGRLALRLGLAPQRAQQPRAQVEQLAPRVG